MALTAFQKQTIAQRYANEKAADIAADLGVKAKQVYDFAKHQCLKKSPEFFKRADSGRITSEVARGLNFQFKKGSVPFNKGKKNTEWMTPSQLENLKKTQFPKGHQPHNAYPDGAEIIHNMKGVLYYKVKIPGVNKLVFKHVKIWVDANGHVPDKHILRFKDGNTLNCTLDNLECISMAENMRRNSIVRYPSEVRSVMHLQKLLTQKIKQHEKQD